MANDEKPRFKKLGAGGDYYAWLAQMECYFKGLGLWQHVSEGTELVIAEGATETAEMSTNKCKKAIMDSLYPDILALVRRRATPQNMMDRIRKVFVGSQVAQRAHLLRKLNELKFEGNYFNFMNQYEATINELEAVNGIASWQVISLSFLDKFPKELESLVQGARRAVLTGTDNAELWTTCFDTILDYLSDTGKYDPTKRFVKHKKTFNAKAGSKGKDRRNNKKKIDWSKEQCRECKEYGHWAKDCPKNKNKKDTKTKDNKDKPEEKKKPMAWGQMMHAFTGQVQREMNDRFFLLDSGANSHVCGNKSWFTSLQKLHKNERVQIRTANGIIDATHQGKVLIELDNGLSVTLGEVLYWKGAPNLISVSTLIENDMEVIFSRGEATIRKYDKDIYVAEKTYDGVFTVQVREKLIVAHHSQRVWHMRLNHCGQKRLEKTVSVQVLEDKDKFDEAYERQSN